MGTTGALQPPGGGASVEELMNFVEMQLDSIGEAPVLGGFVMLGPQDRRRGGACRAMRSAAVRVSLQRPCHDMVRMHASDPLARTATANAAPASRERHTASARAGGPERSVGTHIGWPVCAPLRFSLVGPHLQDRRCPFPRSGGAVHAGPPPAPNPGTHVPWLMHEMQQPVDACVHACMSPPGLHSLYMSTMPHATPSRPSNSLHESHGSRPACAACPACGRSMTCHSKPHCSRGFVK